MAEKLTRADDEELIIGKITDLTSAFIRFIITFLKFIKIEVPKTAENAIGIILLLLFIYLSGGILKLDLSVPMVILYFIIIIVFLEIIAYNISRISRIFSRHSSSENIIKRITEGTITPDEACKEIERLDFDADNIDILVKELSKNNIFTINIQRSLINTQKIYTKNLKTYFGKDTNVELDDEIVIEILDDTTIDDALTEDEIRFIFKAYGENDEIVAKLLLNQRFAEKNLMKEVSQSAKLEYEARKKYNEKPYWLDKHFSTVEKSFRLIYIVIYVSVVLYLYLIYFMQFMLGYKTPANIIFTIIMVLLLLLLIPFTKLFNKFIDIIDSHAKNHKILTLQKYKEIVNNNKEKVIKNETEHASQEQRLAIEPERHEESSQF